MDSQKVGSLLLRLRKEKCMTQKQIGDRLNLSDKTISKWERGLGCPDISLLRELSDLFQVDIEKILEGDLVSNAIDTGNFKRTSFYVCPVCNNIISNTGDASISCCGRRLTALTAKPADEMHQAYIEETEDEYYITFSHEMKKDHYLSFVAYVMSDRTLLVKLYPEQQASVRLPKLGGGKLQHRDNAWLYYYCSRHGLWFI